MSFVQKNYKNGDTLYAVDLNNLVSGIVEANASIATKADLATTYTTEQVDAKLNLKANVSDVYTIETMNQLLSEKADSINVYTKSEVDAKLVSALRYKGSVASEDDLPEDAELGDVYNVEDTGSNYAWNGTDWDNLGGSVDLSGYLTTESAAQVYLAKTDAQSQYATISSVEAGLSEKQPVGDYATIAQLTDGLATKISSKDATALFATQDALSSGLASKQDAGDYPVYQEFSAGADPATRKTIQLRNADTISGSMTNGTGVNLVMVSKWDKADFGSSQLPLNLNSKDGVVQINDNLTVVDNKTLENAVSGLTTQSDVNSLIEAATVNFATSDEVSQAVSTLNSQFTAALQEKPNADDVYLKAAADTKFAFKSEIPTALPNPNALTIKYNGVSAFTYDGSAAETGNFIVNAETIPVSDSDLTSVKNYIDNKTVSVYNLGNFSQSIAAENKAATDGIFNNPKYAVLVYTVNNSDCGYIINNVAADQTVQYLTWHGQQYRRTVTISGASNWTKTGALKLQGKAIVGTSFFKLTTDSTSDEIKAAMTSGTNNLITEDDLNECLTKGYTIDEYTMQSGSIFVGFTGQGFTFTYVGFPNPVQDPAIMSCVIAINGDQYSCIRNATRGVILTSNSSVITELSDKVESKQDKGDYATQDDVIDSTADIATIKAQLQILQDQVQQLKTPSVEPVEITAEASTVSEPDKDVSFAGQIDSTVASITAKSIQASPVLASSRLSATATGDVTIKNIETSGDLAKATANAGLSVNTDEYVSITGSNSWEQTGYNAIEIGLSSAPKSVLIDNVDFTATMSNNAISIFSWQENAVITISNCHFENVSNCLRLSNRDNKPCTINIVNCICDKWADGEYAGFICMQDYTSDSAQAAQEANQFGKISINFTNVIGPNNTRIVGTAKDLYDNHQIYIYTDHEGIVAFGDGSRFPTVSAK